jgi:hypothetical protein
MGVNLGLLLIYLLLFASFGATATCFAQFLYFYWAKGEMREVYLVRAAIGLTVSVVCYGLMLML